MTLKCTHYPHHYIYKQNPPTIPKKEWKVIYYCHAVLKLSPRLKSVSCQWWLGDHINMSVMVPVIASKMQEFGSRLSVFWEKRRSYKAFLGLLSADTRYWYDLSGQLVSANSIEGKLLSGVTYSNKGVK